MRKLNYKLKILPFLIISALFIPYAVYAQEQVQPEQTQVAEANQASSAPANTAPQSVNGTPPLQDSAQPQQPRPRMIRIPENREFSNQDKIQLLLSAHCDFPTKEDLISTINTEMLVKDRNEALKAEENAGGNNISEAQVITRQALAAVGTAGVSQADIETYIQDILFKILSDESNLFTIRRRALEALAYFDNPKNEKMLEFIVTHPDRIKRPLMLVQAILSYPQIAPDKAPAALAKYLDSPNDMIRFVTISTLRNTPGQAALDVLKERRKIEKNHYFQTRLDEAIANHCKKDVFCGSGTGF